MRYFFILLAVLSLGACSYSPEQLRSSYNDLGKAYAKDIKQMADFSSEQRSQVDEFGQQIQQWHRQQRLPGYASLTMRIGKQLQQNGYVARQDIRLKAGGLSELPRIAKIVPELSDEFIREVSKHSWRIIYEIRKDSLFILAIVHKRRDFKGAGLRGSTV